ncbi:hypothetical protein ABT324_23930 [Saccharopolyspora sp. NPDC000359]|uniref:hypothetical protein n=1 Tax=Saccharopolyspora sp. NPDC000359 TaxID=3154251 RepID=UPI00332517AE
MKTGPQIALAVGLGYALGRTRKMKLALTVGGMLLGRRLPMDPKALLDQGAKLVESSPALGKLTGEVRQNLVDAAKSAALAAASNKIDSVGENLSRRAEGLRAVPSQRSEEGSQDEDTEEERTEERPSASSTRERASRAKDTASGRGTRPRAASKSRPQSSGGRRTRSSGGSSGRRGEDDG